MNSNQTIELRRLLDEHGVKYFKQDMGSTCFTAWGRKEINRTTFLENGIGTPLHWTRFTAKNLTPKQVIAATLGRGTCKNVSDPPEGFLCSACGWGDFAEPSHLLTTAKFTNNEHGPNFCPNCGEKVLNEED